MKKECICWMAVVCLSLLLTGLPALAKGKGKGQGIKRPPGWEEGEKRGWQSDVPPGMEHRDNGLPPGLDETEKGDQDGDVGPDEEGKEALEEEAETQEGYGKGLKEKARKEKRHNKRNKKGGVD